MDAWTKWILDHYPWACAVYELVPILIWFAATCGRTAGIGGETVQLKELESIALSHRAAASGWAAGFYRTPRRSRRPALISAADHLGCRIKFLFSSKWFRSWTRRVWITGTHVENGINLSYSTRWSISVLFHWTSSSDKNILRSVLDV